MRENATGNSKQASCADVRLTRCKKTRQALVGAPVSFGDEPLSRLGREFAIRRSDTPNDARYRQRRYANSAQLRFAFGAELVRPRGIEKRDRHSFLSALLHLALGAYRLCRYLAMRGKCIIGKRKVEHIATNLPRAANSWENLRKMGKRHRKRC